MAGFEMIGYCRICAQKNEELISVFGEHGQYLQLYFKLKVCLRVTVMKNDFLPTAICYQCLTKLETCFQLFQLHVKGEDKFQSYQTTSLDLSTKRKNTRSVMHGDYRSFPIKMEETTLDHPKKRRMRRYLLLEEANAAPSSTVETQQPQQNHTTELCFCEECTHNKYGQLPLLAEVIESQTQAMNNVSNLDNSGANISYSVNESGSSSFVNVPTQVPPLVETVSEPQTISSTSENPTIVDQPMYREEYHAPSTSAKKEIPCNFCGKTFTHTGDLNKHRRIHTGERPYKCPQCDKKFSHASNLLRHQKIHSGERPFKCSLCGKGFSRKDKMLSHKKSATCTKKSDNPSSSNSQ